MNYYYHYTSRYNAQGILAAGKLRPSRPSGVTYLTDQLFGNGAEASDVLGIGTIPIEICFAIPEGDAIGISGPRIAAGYNSSNQMRSGGGIEYTTSYEIPIISTTTVVMKIP